MLDDGLGESFFDLIADVGGLGPGGDETAQARGDAEDGDGAAPSPRVRATGAPPQGAAAASYASEKHHFIVAVWPGHSEHVLVSEDGVGVEEASLWSAFRDARTVKHAADILLRHNPRERGRVVWDVADTRRRRVGWPTRSG